MTKESDFLPINGTDFVEFYVGNAKQAAHYYQTAFGFQPLAYADLETGAKERTSYVLRQGKITFVLTTALVPDSAIADHCKLHGDGVKFVAFGWMMPVNRLMKRPNEAVNPIWNPIFSKMITEKLFYQGSIPMEKPSICLWNEKITKGFSSRVSEIGNPLQA